MLNLSNIPQELQYVTLLFALFVLPKLLQRLRLPSAITSFLLGAAAATGLSLFQHDPTIELLATFGIVGLFLFAGLEVDLGELRRNARAISVHLVLRLILLSAAVLAVTRIFSLEARPAWLVSLALFTPSTGFILGSLDSFGLTEPQKFSVKSMAIAAELLALFILFVVLQSESAARLALAGGALLAIIIVLPILFWAFARWIAPHAPKSEFAFLLMLAVVCAFLTRRLGVYYLVGAFLVGMAAQGFRRRLPEVTSDRTLYAVDVFASFFAPFYFFNAGLHITRGDFVMDSLLTGLLFVAVALPIQYMVVALPRRPSPMPVGQVSRVALSMMPTLVFTLVLAGILRDRFDAPPALIGGLLLYTVVSTLIPGFLLHSAPAVWDSPGLSGGSGPARPPGESAPPSA